MYTKKRPTSQIHGEHKRFIIICVFSVRPRCCCVCCCKQHESSQCHAMPVLMQRNETEIYTFGLSLRSARPYNAYIHKHTTRHQKYTETMRTTLNGFLCMWWCGLSTDNKKAANMRDIPCSVQHKGALGEQTTPGDNIRIYSGATRKYVYTHKIHMHTQYIYICPT